MIYSRTHNFLPALKKWMQQPWITGLASLWWRWPRSRGGISTEDRLWNSLWYPMLSKLIISNNIQFIFGIVVNNVLIIEKCWLERKWLIWDQNHVWSQIKTHKIFNWVFIGYQGSCMWPKYASFVGFCPHEWLMILRNIYNILFIKFFDCKRKVVSATLIYV